ncbi:MAG: Dyp-type peroxidase [Acidimicrobiales bacterium]
MSLDLADIQGTILRGYRVDHARHFVLEVVDAAAGRALLGQLAPRITTAAPWTEKPASMLNVGITAAGLAALGVPAETIAGFPEAFRRGATAEATKKIVGDIGPSDPSRWIEGLRNGARVHAILSLWSVGDPAVLEEVTAGLRQAFTGAVTELAAIDATPLPHNKVHFDYTDNIAQPRVEGALPPKRDRPDPQPLTPPGAFLLGHENQYGGTYKIDTEALSTNSSFAAFRMLGQDAAAFERFLVEYGAQAGVDPEMLAAIVCGRWRNGTPLELSPDAATPEVAPEKINDFDYVSDDPAVDDTFGYKCPVGSHIRRTNPRSMRVVGGGGHLHRLIRRAIPYGPPFDPARPDDAERGLVGWFIGADLANQFEFIMGQWVNSDSFVMSVAGPGGANPAKNISGEDILAGINDPASSSFTLSAPGAPNRRITGFPSFVTTRGGAYCYLPSLTALRWIVAP